MAERVSWQSLLINIGIAALGTVVTQLPTIIANQQKTKAPKAPKVPALQPARGAKNK